MATAMGQAPAVTEESNEADLRAQTLCECFQATAQHAPDEVALRSADTGAELTWDQYAARVRRLAGGLAALGVTRRDSVALMLTNRIEFYPTDTAALHLGATPFSIYNTSSPQQISYPFAKADNRVVITERQFVEQIKRYRVLNDEWLPGGDELTPTMKLKRRPIADKYARIFEALYE